MLVFLFFLRINLTINVAHPVFLMHTQSLLSGYAPDIYIYIYIYIIKEMRNIYIYIYIYIYIFIFLSTNINKILILLKCNNIHRC